MKLYCSIWHGWNQSAYRIRNVHFIMRILGSDFSVSSLRLEENIVANHQHLPKGFTSLLDARDLKKVLWFMKRWFPTHLHGLSPTQSLPCSSHSHHPYGLEPGRCMWFPAWVRPPSCCWIWSSGPCSSDPAGSIVGKNGENDKWTRQHSMKTDVSIHHTDAWIPSCPANPRRLRELCRIIHNGSTRIHSNKRRTREQNMQIGFKSVNCQLAQMEFSAHSSTSCQQLTQCFSRRRIELKRCFRGLTAFRFPVTGISPDKWHQSYWRLTVQFSLSNPKENSIQCAHVNISQLIDIHSSSFM